MKWWFRQHKNRKRSLSLARSVKSIVNLKSPAISLVVCLAGVGLFLSGDMARLKARILASVSPVSSNFNVSVDRIAAQITVKILGTDFLGSGILLQHQNNTYTVITNQHVLRAGQSPYQVQTPDGEIYAAKLVAAKIGNQYDLALLSFEATGVNTYDTATIGTSSYLTVGEPIFAAGFPSEEVKPDIQSQLSILSGFTLNPGRIAILLDKALEEGYQIGYTNDVRKGMSGGPLLNIHGEVVGINGKHAYPLWEAPDFYQDGSQPCAPLQELITRSSLAIPIEKGISLTPNLQSLQPSSLSGEKSASNTSLVQLETATDPQNSQIIAQMQAEAEATKNCQDLLPEPMSQP